jgi:hypothetical protein
MFQPSLRKKNSREFEEEKSKRKKEVIGMAKKLAGIRVKTAPVPPAPVRPQRKGGVAGRSSARPWRRLGIDLYFSACVARFTSRCLHWFDSAAWRW